MTDDEIEAFANLCDRCKYRGLEPMGQGRERIITGAGGDVAVKMPDGSTRTMFFPAGQRRLWLCDACWLATVGPKGVASVVVEVASMLAVGPAKGEA